MAKPPTYYIATRPDGTVPPTCGSAADYAISVGKPILTVNLAENVGRTVDHPSPGRRWYDDGPFSYFRMYSKTGETLERTDWPLRLFVVEPFGETGNWGLPHFPYWLLSQQLTVVSEADSWLAFGHRGEKVIDVIERQLPDLARQWAEEWAADPEGTRRRYDAWSQRVSDTGALSDWAQWKARYSRREAAESTARALARAAAEKAATSAGADADTVEAISLRACCLTVGQLLHDRLRGDSHQQMIRALLLGSDLDAPVTVLAT